MPESLHELLGRCAFSLDDVEGFLDGEYATWAKFDADLGYVPSNVVVRDGMDDSNTTYQYEATGERRIINSRGRACRINTYGDSFTQCHQVNDGETWQEMLAAHYGEPIRNFGVGGFGVYQAYLRACRHEVDTATAGEYVLLNIYDDDHVRNIDSCRWIRLAHFGHTISRHGDMFHGNPWRHVRMNVDSEQWEEQLNLAPTPDALRALADRDRFIETFESDPIVRLWAIEQGAAVDDIEPLERLGRLAGEDLPLAGDSEQASKHARAIRMALALQSTEWVLDQTRSWAADEDRKLIVLLSYSAAAVKSALRGRPRVDQKLVDYLTFHHVPFVDTLQSHVEDFKAFNLTPDEYVRRLYVGMGHYNPTGNQFFAFAIKPALTSQLNPPPAAYQTGGDSVTELIAKLA